MFHVRTSKSEPKYNNSAFDSIEQLIKTCSCHPMDAIQKLLSNKTHWKSVVLVKFGNKTMMIK